MTRERIAELLELLVLELGNRVPPPDSLTTPTRARGGTPAEDAILVQYEWAYVKGLASGALMRMRSQLLSEGE